MGNDQKNISVEVFRGVLAMLVFVGHLRSLFFFDYVSLVNPSFFTKMFYLFTGLGHQAVMGFFVLSGYLVGGAVLRDTFNGKFIWKKFLSRRLVRLWIVILPALLTGFVLDQIGMRLNPENPRYRDTPVAFSAEEVNAHGSVVAFSIPANSTVEAYSGSIFFLQDLFTGLPGSSVPLWSLSFEFWFYILFPLFCSMMIPGLSRAKKIAFMLLGAGILWLVPRLIPGFCLWVMGALVAQVGQKDLIPSNRMFGVFGALFGSALILITRRSDLVGEFSDWISGIGGAFILLAILKDPLKRFTTPIIRVPAFAGKICFSLYACHLPFIILVTTVLSPSKRHDLTVNSVLMFGLLMLATLGYSQLFYWLTERNTDWVRVKLERLLFEAVPASPEKNLPKKAA